MDRWMGEDSVWAIESWDFDGNSLGREGWEASTAGGGSTADFIPSEVDHPGLFYLSVTDPAATTDEASVTRDPAQSGHRFGSGTLRQWVGGIIRIPTVVSESEDFEFHIGFINTAAPSTHSRFLTLRMLESINSDAQFYLSSADGGADTDVPSGVTAVDNTWYGFGIEVAADASEAKLYINGQLCCETTAVPTGGSVTVGASLAKAVGTTARSVHVDYIEIARELPVGLRQAPPRASDRRW